MNCQKVLLIALDWKLFRLSDTVNHGLLVTFITTDYPASAILSSASQDFVGIAFALFNKF